MHTSQIVPGIHYVGVNDRETTLFEGLWPLPYGVSYNSYLVVGEKTALIDSVEHSFFDEFVRYVREVIPSGAPDYLVVNHMEPDHSGSIPLVLETFPNLKIVGNKQTIGMIRGFYGPIPEERFHVVGDGSTLDLGGKTLSFYLTPMVHWPETMMTLAKEDGVLFTGDALGTFGVVEGTPVDDDLTAEQMSLYVKEMYRYYSNIVGKYGLPVQRALAKVLPLQAPYVAPTHGPVWHKHLPEVAQLVDRLSRQEGEPGTVIVYGTMYGNTRRIAEMMAEALRTAGEHTVVLHDAGTEPVSNLISDAWRYNKLVVASPTYSMAVFPPVSAFLEAMQVREVKNKRVAAIGEYAWAPAASKIISEWAERLGLTLVGALAVKQAPTEQTAKELAALAENLLAK